MDSMVKSYAALSLTGRWGPFGYLKSVAEKTLVDLGTDHLYISMDIVVTSKLA